LIVFKINLTIATKKPTNKKSKSTTKAPESSESDESEFSCFMGV